MNISFSTPNGMEICMGWCDDVENLKTFPLRRAEGHTLILRKTEFYPGDCVHTKETSEYNNALLHCDTQNNSLAPALLVEGPPGQNAEIGDHRIIIPSFWSSMGVTERIQAPWSDLILDFEPAGAPGQGRWWLQPLWRG